jgi:hypothetical protein
MMFTSWCPFCESEVWYTQPIYEEYQDSGLVVIGMGWDWGVPYNCEEWSEAYGLTYPLIDDTEYGLGEGTLFDIFSDDGVPHNVILNHNMEVIYSLPGFPGPEGMNELYAIIEQALDECGILCVAPCSSVPGDIDGTADEDDDPIIDVMDLQKLADIVYSGGDVTACTEITGEFTGDGVINIIDIFAFATMLSEGTFNN